MTRAQTILENARAELALAIMSGNEARELELRHTIAEMQAQVEAEYVPIDKPEVYSVHTVVIDENYGVRSE